MGKVSGISIRCRKNVTIQVLRTGCLNRHDEVLPEERIAYTMDDERKVLVMFDAAGESGTRVTTIFEPKSENTTELQQQGWQTILDNFKHCAEGQGS